MTENEEWAVVLADYIRQNDQQLVESCDNLLRMFEDDLVPVQSFAEFCDVLGMWPSHFFLKVFFLLFFFNYIVFFCSFNYS